MSENPDAATPKSIGTRLPNPSRVPSNSAANAACLSRRSNPASGHSGRRQRARGRSRYDRSARKAARPRRPAAVRTWAGGVGEPSSVVAPPVRSARRARCQLLSTDTAGYPAGLGHHQSEGCPRQEGDRISRSTCALSQLPRLCGIEAKPGGQRLWVKRTPGGSGCGLSACTGVNPQTKPYQPFVAVIAWSL